MEAFDLTKPLCIFILDRSTNPEDGDDSPTDIVQEYVDSTNKLTDQSSRDDIPVPCPAIRGSTLPFGGWGKPKIAVKISPDKYALVVNNHIPEDSEYKWLDMSDVGIPGDIDPHTKYSYEPKPYIDRPITFRTPKPGKELAIVMNRWGDYSSKISYTQLEKWIAHENFQSALTNINIVQDSIEPSAGIEDNHASNRCDVSIVREEKNYTSDKNTDSAIQKSAFYPVTNYKNSKLGTNEDTMESNSNSVTNKPTENVVLQEDSFTGTGYMVTIETTKTVTELHSEEKLIEKDGENCKFESGTHGITPTATLRDNSDEFLSCSKNPDDPRPGALHNKIDVENKKKTDSVEKERKLKKDTTKNIIDDKKIYNASATTVNKDSKVDAFSEKGAIPKVKSVREKSSDISASKKTITTTTKTSTIKQASKESKPTKQHIETDYSLDKTKNKSSVTTQSKFTPIQRPKSINSNASGLSQSTPSRFKPFSSLSADMKFSKIRRSTEEIFIEKSPNKPQSKFQFGKDEPDVESDVSSSVSSPLSSKSSSVSPGGNDVVGNGDDVFDKHSSTILEESNEHSTGKDDKLSKVLIKGMFSDMMTRARKFSDDFISKESSKSLSHEYHHSYRSYGYRSTLTPDRYPTKRTTTITSKGPRAAKSLSSLIDPALNMTPSKTELQEWRKSSFLADVSHDSVVKMKVGVERGFKPDKDGVENKMSSKTDLGNVVSQSFSKVDQDDIQNQTSTKPNQEEVEKLTSLKPDKVEIQTSSTTGKDEVENQTSSNPDQYHLESQISFKPNQDEIEGQTQTSFKPDHDEVDYHKSSKPDLDQLEKQTSLNLDQAPLKPDLLGDAENQTSLKPDQSQLENQTSLKPNQDEIKYQNSSRPYQGELQNKTSLKPGDNGVENPTLSMPDQDNAENHSSSEPDQGEVENQNTSTSDQEQLEIQTSLKPDQDQVITQTSSIPDKDKAVGQTSGTPYQVNVNSKIPLGHQKVEDKSNLFQEKQPFVSDIAESFRRDQEMIVHKISIDIADEDRLQHQLSPKEENLVILPKVKLPTSQTTAHDEKSLKSEQLSKNGNERPMLGKTKQVTSFDTNFDGEEYIVVDFPSGESEESKVKNLEEKQEGIEIDDDDDSSVITLDSEPTTDYVTTIADKMSPITYNTNENNDTVSKDEQNKNTDSSLYDKTYHSITTNTLECHENESLISMDNQSTQDRNDGALNSDVIHISGTTTIDKSAELIAVKTPDLSITGKYDSEKLPLDHSVTDEVQFQSKLPRIPDKSDIKTKASSLKNDSNSTGNTKLTDPSISDNMLEHEVSNLALDNDNKKWTNPADSVSEITELANTDPTVQTKTITTDTVSTISDASTESLTKLETEPKIETTETKELNLPVTLDTKMSSEITLDSVTTETRLTNAIICDEPISTNTAYSIQPSPIMTTSISLDAKNYAGEIFETTEDKLTSTSTASVMSVGDTNLVESNFSIPGDGITTDSCISDDMLSLEKGAYQDTPTDSLTFTQTNDNLEPSVSMKVFENEASVSIYDGKLDNNVRKYVNEEILTETAIKTKTLASYITKPTVSDSQDAQIPEEIINKKEEVIISSNESLISQVKSFITNKVLSKASLPLADDRTSESQDTLHVSDDNIEITMSDNQKAVINQPESTQESTIRAKLPLTDNRTSESQGIVSDDNIEMSDTQEIINQPETTQETPEAENNGLNSEIDRNKINLPESLNTKQLGVDTKAETISGTVSPVSLNTETIEVKPLETVKEKDRISQDSYTIGNMSTENNSTVEIIYENKNVSNNDKGMENDGLVGTSDESVEQKVRSYLSEEVLSETVLEDKLSSATNNKEVVDHKEMGEELDIDIIASDSTSKDIQFSSGDVLQQSSMIDSGISVENYSILKGGEEILNKPLVVDSMDEHENITEINRTVVPSPENILQSVDYINNANGSKGNINETSKDAPDVKDANKDRKPNADEKENPSENTFNNSDHDAIQSEGHIEPIAKLKKKKKKKQDKKVIDGQINESDCTEANDKQASQSVLVKTSGFVDSSASTSKGESKWKNNGEKFEEKRHVGESSGITDYSVKESEVMLQSVSKSSLIDSKKIQKTSNRNETNSKQDEMEYQDDGKCSSKDGYDVQVPDAEVQSLKTDHKKYTESTINTVHVIKDKENNTNQPLKQSQTYSQNTTAVHDKIESIKNEHDQLNDATKTYSSVVSSGSKQSKLPSVVASKQVLSSISSSQPIVSEMNKTKRENKTETIKEAQKDNNRTEIKSSKVEETKVTSVEKKEFVKALKSLPQVESLSNGKHNMDNSASNSQQSEVKRISSVSSCSGSSTKSSSSATTTSSQEQTLENQGSQAVKRLSKQGKGKSSKKKNGKQRKNDQWKPNSDKGEVKKEKQTVTSQQKTDTLLDGKSCVLLALIIAFMILCFMLYHSLYQSDNETNRAEL